ncbi:hypothetical protein AVEN_189405-1 [Araneus ventricosus]|uniref:Uncharacterized protein n=1 Tax=Araneus ventricosus TaxID=182803 RepID=A0A4Y2HAW3_ARAVE|nr:hypothetical protein AVEN_189404-1 [Araneus ventricosus]GBM62194.1 hypothetical protein AVEN_189405-1 [Araneus ventricosus]
MHVRESVFRKVDATNIIISVSSSLNTVVDFLKLGFYDHRTPRKFERYTLKPIISVRIAAEGWTATVSFVLPNDKLTPAGVGTSVWREGVLQKRWSDILVFLIPCSGASNCRIFDTAEPRESELQESEISNNPNIFY